MKAPPNLADWERRLAPWVDAEWLPLTAFLLLPAALASPPRSGFFFAAALWIGALKWLGWLAFGRGREARAARSLFAAEIFVGLGLLCGWFYLRNLAARPWPASYSLAELGALPWLVAGLHLAAALLSLTGGGWRDAADRRRLARRWRRRAALYLPYTVMLVVALAWVSGSLNPQGSDALYNAVLARFYGAEGLATVAGGPGVDYPSGCAAMLAVAVAASPLDVVQAVNLQHVLLTVTALFLVTTLLARRARCRSAALLHALPMPFLALLPLYSLYPFVAYQGTGRQAAPALLLAICLLPLFQPPPGRWQRRLTLAAQAALCALVAALNPACVPFAAGATLLSLLLVRYASGEPPRPARRAALGYLGLLGVAGLTVLAGDRYLGGQLSRLAGRPAAATPGPPEPGVGSGAAAPRPSPVDGPAALFETTTLALEIRLVRPDPAAWLWRLRPLGFTDERVFFRAYLETHELHETLFGPLEDWQGRWPQKAVPWAAAAAGLTGLAALVLGGRRRRRRDGLAAIVGGAWIISLALEAAVTLAGESLDATAGGSALLALYLRFLLLRCEILLAFVILAAASAALWRRAAPARRRLGRRARRLGAVAALAAAYLSLPLLIHPALVHRAGFAMAILEPTVGPVTPDDLELVAWIDENLSAGDGLVALAAVIYPHAVGAADLMVPAGGPQALPLYGRRADYVFNQLEPHAEIFLDPAAAGGPERALRLAQASNAAYRARVLEELDVTWCLDRGIRYVYIDSTRIGLNPGLQAALTDGRLEPLRIVGDAGLYSLVDG